MSQRDCNLPVRRDIYFGPSRSDCRKRVAHACVTRKLVTRGQHGFCCAGAFGRIRRGLKIGTGPLDAGQRRLL
jgi:hypothetical protein